MLEMLRHSPAVDRVESQLLLFDSGEFADIFTGPGYTVHPRLFLECDLRKLGSAPPLSGSSELELTQWVASDYQAAAELIYTCYVGHSDATINDQYNSLHGSLRFLHNIVRFPGCGIFEANHSWMLRDRRSGALAGMVLCSRVGSDVAHVTQLCVAKDYRGTGLGHMLLRRSAEALQRSGFTALTLTVTEANHAAVKLYERFGFRLRHRFDAMALETRARRR
jgi:ribosomal protein S18 acetylase RimI-like enzyme